MLLMLLEAMTAPLVHSGGPCCRSRHVAALLTRAEQLQRYRPGRKHQALPGVGTATVCATSWTSPELLCLAQGGLLSMFGTCLPS